MYMYLTNKKYYIAILKPFLSKPLQRYLIHSSDFSFRQVGMLTRHLTQSDLFNEGVVGFGTGFSTFHFNIFLRVRRFLWLRDNVFSSTPRI